MESDVSQEQLSSSSKKKKKRNSYQMTQQLHLGIYPRKLNTSVQKNLHKGFTALSLIVSPKWTQASYRPLVNENQNAAYLSAQWSVIPPLKGMKFWPCSKASQCGKQYSRWRKSGTKRSHVIRPCVYELLGTGKPRQSCLKAAPACGWEEDRMGSDC